jgi:hypothetical protein
VEGLQATETNFRKNEENNNKFSQWLKKNSETLTTGIRFQKTTHHPYQSNDSLGNQRKEHPTEQLSPFKKKKKTYSKLMQWISREEHQPWRTANECQRCTWHSDRKGMHTTI